jgi:prepilin-type N-terminal cleavage/methylation domain-containing protein
MVRTANRFNAAERGFTLVELVVVIVIIGVIAGIAAMIIMQGVRLHSDERARSNVHHQARIAVERMAREIRLIRSRSDLTTMTNTNLRFFDISGNAVGFQWMNPDLNRWDGATDAVLATGITAFGFNYYQQDGIAAALAAADVWFVEINLSAQVGGETVQMRTRVHPRNF